MCQRILFRIILGLLGLCTNLAGTNASSVLRLDPPRIVASYGSSISVNCSTDVEYLNMDWEAALGHSEETGPKTVTWTVESLTEWGMAPFCYINVNRTLQDRLPLRLTVYKTPESVSISTVNHTGPMVEGQQYTLKCDIQKVAPVELLTVKWYKGETLVEKGKIDFTDPTEIPGEKNPSTTLQITPKREDDGAQYRCEAELDLGPEGPQPPPAVMSDPFNITVYYGPEISCSSTFTVKQGELFTPNCTVVGYPKPELTWYKEGEIVDFLQTLDRNDAGQYVLTASSSNSIVSHTVEIEVLYAPFAIKELNNTRIDQGYDEMLKCSSVSNPRPEYRWIYPQEANVNITNVDGISLLFIDYATVQNTGRYTCVAHNQLGETSQSVNVDVRDNTSSVTISPVDHSGPMIEGRQYKLRCDVQYVAPVNQLTINWYKGKARVHFVDIPQMSSGTAKTQKTESVTLSIHSNRTDNGAQYKCEAELRPKAGGPHKFNSEALSIAVHYKPVININKLPPVVPVFRGYPEVLICEAEGYPQPIIRWTFKTITKEGGNYTIDEATSENVGVYNCTASNSVDSTVRVVKVILKEDYLPLIAGFVALVVVIISVFFVIIFSIYYKNTKMGRYMVEGAKPNAQNGNVAQNGKDSAIPMKKLSENSYV